MTDPKPSEPVHAVSLIGSLLFVQALIWILFMWLMSSWSHDTCFRTCDGDVRYVTALVCACGEP